MLMHEAARIGRLYGARSREIEELGILEHPDVEAYSDACLSQIDHKTHSGGQGPQLWSLLPTEYIFEKGQGDYDEG